LNWGYMYPKHRCDQTTLFRVNLNYGRDIGFCHRDTSSQNSDVSSTLYPDTYFSNFINILCSILHQARSQAFSSVSNHPVKNNPYSLMAQFKLPAQEGSKCRITIGDTDKTFSLSVMILIFPASSLKLNST